VITEQSTDEPDALEDIIDWYLSRMYRKARARECLSAWVPAKVKLRKLELQKTLPVE
jgi:hypothetical protein